MNYHALLAHFPKLTYTRYQRLMARCGSVEKIWQADFGQLVAAGLPEAIADEFIGWKESIEPETIIRALTEEYITVIGLSDPAYPPLLAQIADPPHALFVRGHISALRHDSAIAIVGTRHMNAYGQQSTHLIAGELAGSGLAVVSGLAYGVDAAAHSAALAAGGITVAVLGGGVAVSAIEPRGNCQLAAEIIASGGAIISEYPPDFKPTAFSFPARNRIIAGLSLGTLVTQAPAKSGALITARCALDYNRDVFAVPHNITDDAGVGCNELIKRGAMAVTGSADIFDALNLTAVRTNHNAPPPEPTDPTQQKLWHLLTREPQHIDELVKLSGLPSAAVGSALMLMELSGLVSSAGSGHYGKKS